MSNTLNKDEFFQAQHELFRKLAPLPHSGKNPIRPSYIGLKYEHADAIAVELKRRGQAENRLRLTAYALANASAGHRGRPVCPYLCRTGSEEYPWALILEAHLRHPLDSGREQISLRADSNGLPVLTDGAEDILAAHLYLPEPEAKKTQAECLGDISARVDQPEQSQADPCLTNADVESIVSYATANDSDLIDWGLKNEELEYDESLRTLYWFHREAKGHTYAYPQPSRTELSPEARFALLKAMKEKN